VKFKTFIFQKKILVLCKLYLNSAINLPIKQFLDSTYFRKFLHKTCIKFIHFFQFFHFPIAQIDILSYLQNVWKYRLSRIGLTKEIMKKKKFIYCFIPFFLVSYFCGFYYCYFWLCLKIFHYVNKWTFYSLPNLKITCTPKVNSAWIG